MYLERSKEKHFKRQNLQISAGYAVNLLLAPVSEPSAFVAVATATRRFAPTGFWVMAP